MLDLIKLALKDECGIDPDLVHEDINLLDDLKIDSLDLLNATFRLEKETGVTLPLQAWLAEEYGEQLPEKRRFVVRELRLYLFEHSKAYK